MDRLNAAALVVAFVLLIVIATAVPTGELRRWLDAYRAHRARDRALMHLARTGCTHPGCATCHALNTRANGATMHTAADDPQRSPDWCWTHGCHRSACPGPHQ